MQSDAGDGAFGAADVARKRRVGGSEGDLGVGARLEDRAVAAHQCRAVVYQDGCVDRRCGRFDSNGRTAFTLDVGVIHAQGGGARLSGGPPVTAHQDAAFITDDLAALAHVKCAAKDPRAQAFRGPV